MDRVDQADWSSPKISSLPPIHFDDPAPPLPHRSAARQLLPFLAVTVLLVSGLSVSVWLALNNQDIRNRAFTGYQTNLSGNKQETFEQLRLAKPEDVPVDSSKVEQNTLRGLFYTLTQLYRYAEPEYQPVVITDLQIAGKVFLKYDPTANQTFLFSQFRNVPVFEKTMVKSWLQSKTNDQYFSGQNVEIYTEDNTMVMYSVTVAHGDLRSEVKNLVFSFDSKQSVQPENPFLVVKF